MKALVYHGPKRVSIDKVRDAKIEKLTDVVIKLTTTTSADRIFICMRAAQMWKKARS